jgi:hypothetical protein
VKRNSATNVFLLGCAVLALVASTIVIQAQAPKDVAVMAGAEVVAEVAGPLLQITRRRRVRSPAMRRLVSHSITPTGAMDVMVSMVKQGEPLWVAGEILPLRRDSLHSSGLAPIRRRLVLLPVCRISL